MCPGVSAGTVSPGKRLPGQAYGNGLRWARALAASAMDTSFRINAIIQKRHPVEERIDSAERAEPLAERPIDENAEPCKEREDDYFPGKKLADGPADSHIRKTQRNPSFQNPLRTDELAESRRAKTVWIPKKKRKQQDKKQKDPIFQPAQTTEAGRGEFPRGNVVEQVLESAERTEKAADKAPEKRPKEDQNPRHVIGKVESARSNHGLQGPDGTDARRGRTRVAVQAGNADMFQGALVELHPNEV